MNLYGCSIYIYIYTYINWYMWNNVCCHKLQKIWRRESRSLYPKNMIYIACIFKCYNFFIFVKHVCICHEVHVAQIKERERQCPHNVTLRTVRATVVVRRKLWVLRILSLCLWPQLSSIQSPYAILYCHLLPHFAHYLINSTIFGRKLLNIKSCFGFHRNLCRKRISF